ncbi:MAG TPA: hypothetical protein VJ438_06010 [Candidatus Nanoarchaeia archaeon]|nr:hypothetical protein [Candidatus Nanoarchaeia archaeon]
MMEEYIKTTYECKESITFTPLGWVIFITCSVIFLLLIFIFSFGLLNRNRGCP